MAVKLASIKEPEAKAVGDGGFGGDLGDALSVPLPPELQGKDINVVDTLEAPNPTVVFAEIGEYIVGRYQGMRELTISKRLQRLYDIRLPSGSLVSVWGSKILDSRIDQAIAKGMAVNSSVMIQYLGDIDTGQVNPAHNFRIAWK